MMISRPTLLLLLMLAVASLALGGCIPEESPIAPFDRGPVRNETFPLGSQYGTQMYFDLETGQLVQSTPTTMWDLALRSDAGGHHIFLNTSTIMAAADLGTVAFRDVRNTTGAAWFNDRPDGSWDSTAIGEWWRQEGGTVVTKGHVYLIDRGFTPEGKRRGYMKLEILGADAASYRIHFAALNGSNEQTVTVQRDMLRRFTGFSFDGAGSVVQIEPPKDKWDILFTRYTHIFYEDTATMPYAVTGVFLNPERVSAAADSARAFESITAADLASYTFSRNRDKIGYDWKSYDLDAGKYTVYPKKIYLVKRHEGLSFKLRFVEFYSDGGESGYPRMEWQSL